MEDSSEDEESSESPIYRPTTTAKFDALRKNSFAQSQNTDVQAQDQIRELTDRLRFAQQELEQKKKEYEQLQDANDHCTSNVDKTLRSLNDVSAELDQTKIELVAVYNRLDKLSLAHETLQDDSKAKLKETNFLQNQLEALSKENTHLRSRYVLFDSLISDEKSKSHKKWQASSATKQLEARIKFYEQQLRESDDTLVATKQSFAASSRELMDEVKALESSLEKTKSLLEEALESKAHTQQSQGRDEQKLNRALADRMRLAEKINQFEVRCTQQKMELIAADNEIKRLSEVVRFYQSRHPQTVYASGSLIQKFPGAIKGPSREEPQEASIPK